MNLHRVRDLKQLYWPAEFTPTHPTKKFTRLGEYKYKLHHRVVRGSAGFIIDLDAPGESLLCKMDIAFLNPVPRDEYPAALKAIRAQGPITFQPAIDWLEEQGLREITARPTDEAPDPDAPVDLGKLKKRELQALCDEYELPHGSVKEMRAALAEAAEAGDDE